MLMSHYATEIFIIDSNGYFHLKISLTDTGISVTEYVCKVRVGTALVMLLNNVG